jgi:altronate dehydratase large subunit
MMQGYPRADGRKGIRNIIVVGYLVECAHHVAREIAIPFREQDVHVIGFPGFPGCYPNAYAETMMERLCTHPNVGAVLLISLGCESFNKYKLDRIVRESGRPVQTVVIQASGGTRKSVSEGRAFVAAHRALLDAMKTVPMSASELIVGTVCGGSDGTSGISGNPAAGRAFDMLVEEGAACIFEETGELIGCEQTMAARAITPGLGAELEASVAKAARYYATLGYGSFAAGNAEGGHHDRGEVDGRLREVGRSADLGPDQTRRHSAARRSLPARCGSERRGPLRLPQHQRQCRDRRIDRLRQPCDPVRHRAGLGRRVRHIAGGEDLRQSRDL